MVVMQFLAFSASLRTGSLNHKLLLRAIRPLEADGHTVRVVPYTDVVTPNYDADAQTRDGFPAAAEALREALLAADGWLLASPEYNYSMPGALKNTLDWLSRYRPMPFINKPTLLLSASPGLIGGNRGLWALRVPLESMGALVHPNMFSLSQAAAAFADDGDLKDAALGTRLDEMVRGFAGYAGKLVG